jgi:hypothetical protein
VKGSRETSEGRLDPHWLLPSATVVKKADP